MLKEHKTKTWLRGVGNVESYVKSAHSADGPKNTSVGSNTGSQLQSTPQSSATPSVAHRLAPVHKLVIPTLWQDREPTREYKPSASSRTVFSSAHIFSIGDFLQRGCRARAPHSLRMAFGVALLWRETSRNPLHGAASEAWTDCYVGSLNPNTLWGMERRGENSSRVWEIPRG